MSTENIKVGETYYVRVKVKTKGEDYIRVTPILQGGVLSTYWPTSFALAESSAFSPIPPENENSEPAPKYDPCRRFRKGDKVRIVEWKGRNPVLPFMDCKVGDIGTVIKEEDATSFFVRLHLEGKYEKDMPYCHLELVTPVEELEPYKCGEGIDAQLIFVNDELFAEFENEKDAARVCALLNAEYRKENRHECTRANGRKN